jgi:hypothetical protein
MAGQTLTSRGVAEDTSAPDDLAVRYVTVAADQA